MSLVSKWVIFGPCAIIWHQTKLKRVWKIVFFMSRNLISLAIEQKVSRSDLLLNRWRNVGLIHQNDGNRPEISEIDQNTETTLQLRLESTGTIETAVAIDYEVVWRHQFIPTTTMATLLPISSVIRSIQYSNIQIQSSWNGSLETAAARWHDIHPNRNSSITDNLDSEFTLSM